MSKNISTILNLVDRWTSPMRKMAESTNSFQKVVKEATATTKIFSDKNIGSIKRFENQITHMSNSMTRFGNNTKNIFSSTASKVALFTGGLGLAAAAKQSIELASSLVEIQNVVDETFGGGAKQINAWSKTALNSFGLSTLQAKQFTGYLGAMMKSSGITGNSLIKMSENLSGLAGDIASFDNLPIEDAFEKIRSGISGETEPLKQLGINMDVTNLSHYALAKGIKTSWNEMSQAQQTMLRYQYLMSVTKDKQGDFIRTQNTFANQVRLAKVNLQQLGASIGTYALPPLNKILNAFNSGSMKSIGTIATNAFKSISDIAKSTKEPLEALGRSLKNFANAAGISKLFKDLFSGVNTDTLEKVKIGINEVIYRIKQLVDFATNHVNGIKAFGSALAGVFVGVNIARKVFEIKNGMNDIIKAVNGAKKVSKGEALFETIFKMSPRSMIFVTALAGIGLVAYEIITHWTQVKSFFDKFFNDMHGGMVLNTAGALALFGAMVKFNTVGHVFNFIDKVKDKFDSLRIAGMYAADAVKKVGSGIGTGISKGAGLIRTLGSNLLGVGRNALTASKNIAVMTANVAKQGAIFAINAVKAGIYRMATLAVSAAQKIAAGTQAALNFVMNMNPLVRIVTVIFSLVGALVVLYNKNVWFRNKVNAVFAWFGTLPAKFKGWAHDMINGFVKGIEEKFAPIKKAAKGIADIVKKFLHFSKPDEGPLQQYEQWMPDFVNGMSAGMENTSPSIYKTTSGMTTGMGTRIRSFTAQCNPLGVAVVNQLKAGISNSGAQSGIMSTVKTLTTKVINAFKNGFGIHSPSRVFFKLGNYIVQGFVNGLNSKDMGGFIKNWIGSITSSAGTASGNVSAWLTAALGITGQSMSNLPALLKIAMHESGGNPLAINLWDSNAMAGHPSKGLMQTIDSTFNTYAIKGLGNVWNPIANAVAAIRYMIARYGSIQNVPGVRSAGYVGYAMGTNNAMPGIAQVAENGIELVVGRQFKRFKGGEKVLNNAQTKALIGGDGNPNVSVFVTVQGNMVGNEEYAESLGEYIFKKITDARRKI